MELFSERYGYTKPSDTIIREKITPEIESAICNSFSFLQKDISYRELGYVHSEYPSLEKFLWIHFFNKKIKDYFNQEVAIPFLESDAYWFMKLDCIDKTLEYLDYIKNKNHINKQAYLNFISNLNSGFERHKFAYRIIENKVVEITSKEEIVAIEDALSNNKDNIKSHLSKALELYALKPEGDYCNSIKESISAVEAYCREKTGENTLGDALKKLEKVGVVIPNVLRTAFDKLYAYTNQPTTGIRHALMDSEGTYVPKAEEALFMLVACSAFINYLNKK
ncbi:MAG: hypothetical protein IJE15_03035 [Bacteroidaceae bacterium]|nr:hypothetical protein [Bacteroidaceae bacterium]